MKACPVCALELEDSYLFCPDDGSSLAATEPATEQTTKNDTFSARPPSTKADEETTNGVEFIEQGDKESGLSASASAATEPQRPQPLLSKDYEPEHQGFRIAAIATIIAIGVFAVAGLYALGSNLLRRPATASRTASQTETAQAVPFVVTPEEALNYKEEIPAASAASKESETPATSKIVERSSKEFNSPSSEQRDRKTTVASSVPTPPTQTTAVSATARQASDPPAPASPRAHSGEFDSRLVRARASRISSGYRYDLTFNMQEQRGRSAQWQRVLITTRSAGGTSRTQAIPFVHRLGATGALTFTISVELTGRSEADWRGHINCTTLGWDNTGAPLQASFAANVTP